MEKAMFQNSSRYANLSIGRVQRWMNLDTETFARDFEQPIRGIISNILDSYYPHEEVIVIKMKTDAHEAARFAFNNLLIEKSYPMSRAHLGLLCTGQKTIFSLSRVKEPDLSYQPNQLPRGRSGQWPTLVVESGYSESRDTLNNNAKWGVSESGGDVKIAITVYFHRQRHEVHLKLYEWLDSGTSNGQYVTGSNGADVQSAKVANGPLVVGLRSLFLRRPSGTETDITFTDNDIRYLVKDIWIAQFGRGI